MSVIQIQPPFDIRVDFWVKNFALKFVSPFDELYENRGHKESSDYMWCLWLHEHPSTYNPYRNLDKEDKLEAIKRHVNWFDPKDKFQSKCVGMFNQVCLSTVAKGFKSEDESLIQRQEMIIKLQEKFSNLLDEDPLSLKDRETIALMKYHEDMRKNTAKIYEAYDEARRLFEDEEGELVIHGGGSEDIAEAGRLLEIEDK